MKLKMLTSMSGALLTLNRGDITDVFSDKEARRMIKAGFAEPAAEEVAADALAAKTEELEALGAKHKVAETTIENLNADLATAHEKIEALGGEIEALKAEAVARDGELKAVTDERDALKARVAELSALLDAAGSGNGEGGETTVKPKAAEKRG